MLQKCRRVMPRVRGWIFGTTNTGERLTMISACLAVAVFTLVALQKSDLLALITLLRIVLNMVKSIR